MLIEAVITINQMVQTYGYQQSWLIMSFLFSIGIFISCIIGSWIINAIKSGFEKAPLYFLQFIFVQLFLAAFMIFEALFYSTSITTNLIFSLFEFGTFSFVLFVFPLSQVYHKIMEKYPVLPWHVTMFLISLLGSLVFWALLFFVFGVFVPEPPPL